MTTIGITGGIGSGKSYVARLLATEFAVPVFDCDAEAKRLMTDDPAVRSSLIAAFGPAIYLPDGTLDRPLLADLIFRRHRAPEVNAIVHPAVRRRFEAWREEMSANAEAQPMALPPAVAIESAILIESGFTDLCDQVWLVTAPEPLRIERAMRRDNAPRSSIQARIAAQTPDSALRRHATHIIRNDASADLLAQIREAIMSARTYCPNIGSSIDDQSKNTE